MMRLFSVIALQILILLSCGAEQKESTQDRLSSTTHTARTWHIAYWANLNANLENCLCGDPPLGGLDRIAATVDSLREAHPGLIVIDGGDSFGPYPYAALNRLVLQAQDIVKPDLRFAGDQERREKALFNKHKDRFFGTAGDTVLSRYGMLISAWLEPSLAMENEPLPAQSIVTSDSTLDVVLYHGPDNGIEAFIKKHPGIDLLLTAHTQRPYKEMEGSPFVVSGGADGEILAHIRVSEKAGQYEVSARFLPMYLEKAAHPGFDPIIEAYNNLEKQ